MLVQFSMTISRLSDQNTVLAQRLALLQQRVDEQPGDAADAARHAASPEPRAADDPPSDQATAQD